MPSKRAKNKKQIAVWLSPEEKRILKAIADTKGVSMSDVLKEKIYEQHDKNKKS